VKLAVIGDVHLRWDGRDVAYFRDAGYERILFVGDLAAYSHRAALEVARSIAALGSRALVLPGNHDGIHAGQLVAEMTGRLGVSYALGGGQARRCREIAAALGDAELCGYSRHTVRGPAGPLTIVAARPHSMGGSYIAYRRYLEERFGVGTLAGSADRLRSLVDGSEDGALVFLAHCGPSGLGTRRADIWGCDFRRAEGDWGDEDLRLAVAHATARGRRVLAVVAGHMHHAVKGGGLRPWSLERDGVLYVNAARVPRIFRCEGRQVRHHIALEVGAEAVTAREVLVSD
jgi:uncharacterized protein (TIGR04168 family)